MTIPAINIHDHRNGTRAGGAVMAWPIGSTYRGTTMSTDWRALCAELVEQLERYQSDFPPKTDKMAHRAMAADAVLARACAALTAEADGPAVPEGREPASVVSEPSDEELDVLADEWLDWNLEGHRAFARAAIAADRARYRHHPTPVPVAERLPGPGDCDAEGRCWWWYPPVPERNYGYWIYVAPSRRPAEVVP